MEVIIDFMFMKPDVLSFTVHIHVISNYFSEFRIQNWCHVQRPRLILIYGYPWSLLKIKSFIMTLNEINNNCCPV